MSMDESKLDYLLRCIEKAQKEITHIRQDINKDLTRKTEEIEEIEYTTIVYRHNKGETVGIDDGYQHEIYRSGHDLIAELYGARDETADLEEVKGILNTLKDLGLK